MYHSHTGCAGMYSPYAHMHCCPPHSRPECVVLPYVICPPAAASPCTGATRPFVVPHELAVDPSSPQEALVGGSAGVHLSLEVLVGSGVTTAEVTVTVTADGATSTWNEKAIAEGYHVKTDFLSVQPGAKVTVKVTDAMARLRWCETVCC